MAVAIDMSGRTIWVTGGASGIGAATVSLFVRAGARVVSLDCAHAPDRFVTEGQTIRAAIDLRSTGVVNRVVAGLAEAGLQPDVLISSAGVTRDGVCERLSDEAWAEVIDVNLTGAFRITRACAPMLAGRQGAAIVNISSINGLRGRAGQANYAASKGGLIALTKTLARELARAGVRVNAVAPGLIDTPMTRRVRPDVLARSQAEILLGAMGHPDHVAAAVLFLASPLAAHITGQVLVVDGGQLLSCG